MEAGAGAEVVVVVVQAVGVVPGVEANKLLSY